MLNAKEKMISEYMRQHPESAAAVLNSHTAEKVSEVIEKYDSSCVANVINLIPASHLVEALLLSDNKTIAKISNKMGIHLIAGLLRTLKTNGETSRVEGILELMDNSTARSVKSVIQYPPNFLGSLMNPTPFSALSNISINELLDILSKSKNSYSRYIYIIDNERKLIGVLPFKDAFYANSNEILSKVMTKNPFSFNSDLTVKRAMKDKNWGQWDSIPITNTDGELIGVVRYDVLSNYYASNTNSFDNTNEVKKAGEAVGEVLQIGMTAAIAAFGLAGNRDE